MRLDRHNAILKLIRERSISTQTELTDALRELGYDVTQATVSRDMKDLRLVKRADSGKYVYTQSVPINDSELSDRFSIVFKQCVTDIDYALNDVVVKTLSGMAQAAAATIDALEHPEIVGSLAGDDTVILVVRNEESAKKLASSLREILES